MNQSNNDENYYIKKALNYRQLTASRAQNLLEKLFVSMPSSFAEKNALTVLVIGAGTFPSYMPLLNVLTRMMPQLKNVSFTLIEPLKATTDLFEKHFAEQSSQVQTDFTIYNMGIKNFLKQSANVTFDIIYFEHPETSTLSILPAKLGVKYYAQKNSLRECIPYLLDKLTPQSLIIASCMSRQELAQLKWLLNFSFDTQARLVKLCKRRQYFYAGPYSSGVFVQLQDLQFCNADQRKLSVSSQVSQLETQQSERSLSLLAMAHQRARAIERCDNYLCGFLLMTFVIYGMSLPGGNVHSIERLFSVLTMMALLLWHRPGMRGLMIKLVLLSGLVGLNVMGF